jgi:hypothetical protein
MPRARRGDWPSQFARILAEALAGTRPARPVMTWTAARARQRIRGPSSASPRERQAGD